MLSLYSQSDPTSHAKSQDFFSLSLTYWLFQHFISWLALGPRFLRTERPRNSLSLHLYKNHSLTKGKFYRLKIFFFFLIGPCWLLEMHQRALVWSKIYPHHLFHQFLLFLPVIEEVLRSRLRKGHQHRNTLRQALRISTRDGKVKETDRQREKLRCNAV